MGGVAVVRAEQQAVGAGADALLPVNAQLLLDADQHIGHQGALCALAAGRAHFLVVEHDPDIPAAFLVAAALQEAPEGGVGAFQIIDAAGHEILALQAHALSLFPGAENQIAVHDLLGTNPGLFSQNVPQGCPCRAEDGLQIHLRVILHAVVQIPVEVDAEVGDAGQRPVRVYQHTADAALGADQDAARHAQGTVHPGGHDHAAVALGLGLGKDGVPAAVQLLDPPGGRITVAGGHMPAGQLAPGHPPGQHCRAVAGGVVLAAGGQLPGRAFGAVPVAVGFQDLHRRCSGMERADTGVQKIEETFDGKSSVLHSSILLQYSLILCT